MARVVRKNDEEGINATHSVLTKCEKESGTIYKKKL